MRVYANDLNYISKDQKLLDIYDELKEMDKESEEYKNFYKIVCDNIRRIIGSKNVVGLAKFKDNEVVIFEYEVKATADNFYPQHFDEEVGKLYIEV
jgi:hypothetical protein